MRLDKRTAIITGAAKGIGAGTSAATFITGTSLVVDGGMLTAGH